MTFDGIVDPYMRASIIEYIQFMRLTESLAVKPKEYMYKWSILIIILSANEGAYQE